MQQNYQSQNGSFKKLTKPTDIAICALGCATEKQTNRLTIHMWGEPVT
jgi:hypothetical protein